MSKEKTLEDVIGFLMNVAKFDLEKTKRVSIPGGAMTVTSENYQYMYEGIEWFDNRLKEQKLNENQQIVLEYLKKMCPPKLGLSAMVTVYCLVDDNINDNWQEYSDEAPEHIEALQKLSVAEENHVLEVFAKWALEQEEE